MIKSTKYTRIKKELAELLKVDGFSSVQEAVGADHRHSSVSSKSL
jgi:dihydroorotate dehydrogenase